MQTKSSTADQQAPILQHSVTAVIDLALTFKHLHWNIRGPRFKSIHEFLDIVIDHARAGSDELAERLVTVGVPAQGQREALPATALHTVDPGFISDESVIEHAVKSLETTVAVLRDAQEKLGNLDAVSEDLVIGILANLEKDLWMLRSHLA